MTSERDALLEAAAADPDDTPRQKVGPGYEDSTQGQNPITLTGFDWRAPS